MTLDEIVEDYIREYRDAVRSEMRFFEIQRSSSEAIRKAALCMLPSGKRHPHQRRIPKAVLEQAEARLQESGRRLARASDFAALHRLVDEQIGRIPGIGALTVYDIAHRIGAHLGKAPERVYLHAGTRTGARMFGVSGDSFDPKLLPKSFSRLAPSEIEDCLCIYKDELHGNAGHRRHSECGVAKTQRLSGVIYGLLIPNPIKYIIALGRWPLL
jgi:hypothetical protein